MIYLLFCSGATAGWGGGEGRERQPFLASQVKTLKNSGLNKLFQAQLIAQN